MKLKAINAITYKGENGLTTAAPSTDFEIEDKEGARLVSIGAASEVQKDVKKPVRKSAAKSKPKVVEAPAVDESADQETASDESAE